MYCITISITDDKFEKETIGIYLKIKNKDIHKFKKAALAFSFFKPLIGTIDDDYIVTDKKTGKDSTDSDE